MCTLLRAAGCVYQWIPTVPGANSAGLSLASINLLWQCEEPHPARGSNTLLSLPLFSSNSLNFPYPFCSQPHFFPPLYVSPTPFALLFFSFQFSHLPPSLFLSSFPHCLSSSIWPHPSTKSFSCQAMDQERGSCELVRSEINKARTGWTIYPEKMHFVLRMGTAGHKSWHPGCLLGRARWSSSSLSSSSGGSRGLIVNSYVSRPITASRTDKSILAGVMKGTLMHVHIWVASMKYEWAVSYMSWQHTVDGFSYEGGTYTRWNELTISWWW